VQRVLPPAAWNDRLNLGQSGFSLWSRELRRPHIRPDRRKDGRAYLREQAGLEDYPKEIMRQKKRDLYTYQLFRSMFIRANDGEFVDILKSFEGFFPIKKVQAVDVPDIIFKLIFRNPGLLKTARYQIAR
jgi:hypothetical protein